MVACWPYGPREVRTRLESAPMPPAARVNISSLTSQARQFTIAMQRCLPASLADGVWEGPVAPGVVCGAFAIELWLKALFCISNPSGSVPRKHDLVDLFSRLPEKLGSELIGKCPSYAPPEKFAASLQVNARVFETWRYAYEHGPGPDGSMLPLEADVRLLIELADACETVYTRLYAEQGGPFPPQEPTK